MNEEKAIRAFYALSRLISQNSQEIELQRERILELEKKISNICRIALN